MEINVETIQELIGSLGFPIVACIIMFIQNGKLQRTLRDFAVTLEKISSKLDTKE